MAATYKNTSLYASTDIVNGSYLGFWRPPTIVLDGYERKMIIEPKFENRPDLLSHYLFGTPDLWWVFSMVNPDVIQDPLSDLVAGVEIIVPHRASVI